MIELVMEQTKEKWLFTAYDNKEVIAEVIVVPHGKDAVIHNNIYKFTKNLLAYYKQMFLDIRGVLRENGVNLVIPCSGILDKKKEKYFRLFGFECFGSVKENGKTLHFAVMEA